MFFELGRKQTMLPFLNSHRPLFDHILLNNNLKSEDIIDILNAQDRRKAGKTANPEGLYLKDVLY